MYTKLSKKLVLSELESNQIAESGFYFLSGIPGQLGLPKNHRTHCRNLDLFSYFPGGKRFMFK